MILHAPTPEPRAPAPGWTVAGLKPAPRITRADLMWVVALTVLAAALRIPGLDQGLWIDEILTLEDFVKLHPLEIISSYESRNNHILYSLLAHFSIDLFGESAWSLRLPALVAGIATIPAAWYLARQFASRHEALLATAFLVFSYHHVWFSQNARGYSGVLLGAVVSSILFVRLLTLRRPGAGTVFGYGLAASLTSWFHLGGAATMVAHGLVWLTLAGPWASPGRAALRPWALAGLAAAGVLAALMYLPTLQPVYEEIVVTRAQGLGPFPWHQPEWVFDELLAGTQRAVPGGWPVVVVAWLTLMVGVWGYIRQGWVAAGLLLAPIAAAAAMLWVLDAIFFPRFFLGSLVFVLLLGVRGGFDGGRWLLPRLSERSLLAVGLAVALATAVMVPRAWAPKQDFTGAIAWLRENVGPEDALACSRGVAHPTRYFGMPCVRIEDPTVLAELEARHERVWFVYTQPVLFQHRAPRHWRKLQRDYSAVRRFSGTVVGGDLVVMVNDRGRSTGSRQ